MTTKMPYKVLCVCLGNICRSPTAEVVLRHYCQAEQLDIEIDSAGTSNYHPNKAPDLRSQKHALKRGYDLSSLRARQLTQQDFVDFDSVHDKFHRTLILSGFCLLKIAKISLNSSFFPKPIKR